MSLSRRQFIQASGIALCAGAVPLKASAAGQQQPLPVHRGHQQVLFVVTQADKTEPCHEWDMAGIQPSPAQAQNIREKTDAVFRLFRPVHPVVAVSACTGWELDTLVSALMTALPDCNGPCSRGPRMMTGLCRRLRK